MVAHGQSGWLLDSNCGKTGHSLILWGSVMNKQDNTDSRIESLLRIADQRLRYVEHLFAYVAVFFIFTLMMLGVAGIAARQLSSISIFGHSFDITIFGYIDMVELLMTTFAFLAISHAERIGAHVRMDLMVSRLRGRALWVFELFSVLRRDFPDQCPDSLWY